MYDKSMDFKNKFYQMFVLAPEGTTLKLGGNLDIALKKGLGGVIFFTKNIEAVEQVKELTKKVKQNAIIAPFVGIDEEGGRVERTENIFGGKKFLSARYQAQNGVDCVISQTLQISNLIKSLGFNMNFAPVLDVDTNPQNPIIAERSYGRTPAEVEKFALCAMNIYLQNGIIPVGKHFPGHGDVNVDSHLTLPVLDLALDKLEKIHIRPFKTAVEQGIPAIMAAHLHCKAFDKDIIPTSLSSVALDYLRKNLGFGGLIVSDDMEMGALKLFTPEEAILRGISAGINLFLFRDERDATISLIERVFEKVKNDTLLCSNVEKSFELIQKVKQKFFKL